jgi:hypothetical protein
MTGFISNPISAAAVTDGKTNSLGSLPGLFRVSHRTVEWQRAVTAREQIIGGGYVPNGWTFYAPTALAHGKACLEITNFHPALPPAAAIGVYDFCNAHDWVQTIALNDPATRNCCVRSYTDPWDGTLRQRYFV